MILNSWKLTLNLENRRLNKNFIKSFCLKNCRNIKFTINLFYNYIIEKQYFAVSNKIYNTPETYYSNNKFTILLFLLNTDNII